MTVKIFWQTFRWARNFRKFKQKEWQSNLFSIMSFAIANHCNRWHRSRNCSSRVDRMELGGLAAERAHEFVLFNFLCFLPRLLFTSHLNKTTWICWTWQLQQHRSLWEIRVMKPVRRFPNRDDLCSHEALFNLKVRRLHHHREVKLKI